jgi:hypothetical protein
MRIVKFVVAASAALMVSSCGGNSSEPTPTSMPTATATPTPNAVQELAAEVCAKGPAMIDPAFWEFVGEQSAHAAGEGATQDEYERAIQADCTAAWIRYTALREARAMTPTATPTATRTPTPPPTPTPTVTPTPTPGPRTSFGTGTWLVGSEVVPGTYSSSGNDTCYWARLSGLGGTVDDIIANNYGGGRQVVTIAASDVAFESDDCGTWTLVP